MTSLREFFSLPMGSRGPENDTPVGVDEFGRTVFQDALGNRYTMGEAAPTTGADVRNALSYAMENPWDAARNVAGAVVEGAWNGIEAPGNALRGETLTYGDVADTALDWGVMSAVGRAPQGALRSGFAGDDYRGVHRAPGREAFDEGAAARLDDMTAVFPDDVYDSRVAAQYYGHGGNHAAMDRESLQAIWSARNNPDAMVTVYRAVPDSVGGELNPGDWVTLSRRYAEEHGQGLIGDPRFGESGGYRIIEQQVPASELFTDGNSINEFGWSPVRNSSGNLGVDNSGISAGVPADGPETPAQRVARFLSEGRASEVTDDLMAQVDPQEMARLYEGGATGMDMPLDEASRMARAREMGFDTGAYHATRAQDGFQVFRPGHRGSIYLAATPEGAASGALGGAQDFAQVSGPSSTATIPVVVRGDDVARLRPSREQWESLPERAFVHNEAELANSVGGRYPDDVYDASFSDTGDISITRRPFPAQEYAADVRSWTGEMLPGWNEGSDIPALERVAQRSGQRGFLVSDEAGASIVAGPDMPIRSRFARFDPRLSHLANLSAGIGAGAVMLSQQDEENALDRLRAFLNQ